LTQQQQEYSFVIGDGNSDSIIGIEHNINGGGKDVITMMDLIKVFFFLQILTFAFYLPSRG
jgi:hypothetical protein